MSLGYCCTFVTDKDNNTNNVSLECVEGDMLDELVSMLTGGMTDESFEMDDSDSAVSSSVTARNSERNILSLLELSSRAVAKHCSCASLEKHSPPLDEGLLRRVDICIYTVAFSCLSLSLSDYINLCLYVCLIGE